MKNSRRCAFICFLVLLISNTSFGQNNIFTVKVYGNVPVFNSSHAPQFEGGTAFPIITPAIAWGDPEGKFYFELEPGVHFQKLDNADFSTDEFSIAARFEMGKFRKVGDSDKLKFGWGASLRAFYYEGKRQPKTSSAYAIESLKAGLVLSLLPRMQYFLTDKILIDLNLSLLNLDFGVDLQTIKNPNLTTRQQEQGGFDFDALGERIVRLGIGYLF